MVVRDHKQWFVSQAIGIGPMFPAGWVSCGKTTDFSSEQKDVTPLLQNFWRKRGVGSSTQCMELATRATDCP
jgi:hypothetical protein